MDPLTALAALLPLVIDAGKAGIQRFILPEQAKPTTYADQLQGRRLDLEMFQAMQGAPGSTYPWVEAIRQLQRPAFAVAVVLVWSYQAATVGTSASVDNMAACVGFYLFGDRTLLNMRGNK